MAACPVLRLTQKAVCLPTSGSARLIHSTYALSGSVRAGKHSPTRDRSKALTYEQSNPPPTIAHKKAWNSWNTTTLEGGLRVPETTLEDLFIRKFIIGTFPGMILSEVIIKRQHNIVRVAAIVLRRLGSLKYAFLIGYSEELLGHWLQCPVKLELQFVENRNAIIFKYI